MFRRSLIESTIRAGSYKQAPRVHGSGSCRPFDAFPQIPQNARAFSGLTKKSKINTHFESSILGNLGMKLGLLRVAENDTTLPYALTFRSSIHSETKPEVEAGRNLSSVDIIQDLLEQRKDGMNNGPPSSYQPLAGGFSNPRPRFRDSGPGFLQDNRRNMVNGRYETMESNADIVHIKLMRNNAFVTVTDSKGNKKAGVSAGTLAGTGKLGRYAGEAAAEDIGRRVRQMKTKSVVVKVNGYTFFRRKKEAILSFKDGYSNSRGDMNPVVYVEDTTRKPHNGCRRPKKRRI